VRKQSVSSALTLDQMVVNLDTPYVKASDSPTNRA
jgi:hypothetical protein